MAARASHLVEPGIPAEVLCMNDFSNLLRMLSSKSVMERKRAIRHLKARMRHEHGYMARLSLQYVSEHDPCYTVRNIARQAFYSARAPPPQPGNWERVFLFQKE